MKRTHLVLVFKLVFGVLLFGICAEVVDSIPKCADGPKDFTKIIGTKTFIDKTLLIFEFLNNNIVFLTSPPGYGKSTNIDMVKRFLEIDVDENGQPKDVKTTPNYDVFVKNNLDIIKNKSWFDEHFGTYPVVHVDYGRLCGIDSFDSMLSSFRQILKDTFSQHKYLLRNPKLWMNEEKKQLFTKYTETDGANLSEEDMKNGFHWLSRLLNEHFSRKVFVLIDEFDTFLNDLPEKLTSHEERIIPFIVSVNDDFLKDNEYTSQAMILGGGKEKKVQTHPNNLHKDMIFYSNKYWQYFGITELELEILLPVVVQEYEEIYSEDVRLSVHDHTQQLNKYYRQFTTWEYYGFFRQPKIYKIHSFNHFFQFIQNKTKSES